MINIQPFRIDRYVVLRRLKSGGFGVVYAGWDEELQLPIAVKELRSERLGDPEQLQAFQAEARLTVRLNHPFICRLYALRHAQDRLYMIMEYVDGCDLQQLTKSLAKHGERLSLGSALHIIQQAGEALAYAHDSIDPSTGQSMRLVHRDVTPSNIMVTRYGQVKLVDFGIARFHGIPRPESREFELRGTLRYMSPEQVSSPRDLDQRSDIFSLALVLLELISGKSVYETTDSDIELIDAVRYSRFDLQLFLSENDVPKALCDLLSAALRPAKAERLSSMREFCEGLQPAFALAKTQTDTIRTELKTGIERIAHPNDLQQLYAAFVESEEVTQSRSTISSGPLDTESVSIPVSKSGPIEQDEIPRTPSAGPLPPAAANQVPRRRIPRWRVVAIVGLIALAVVIVFFVSRTRNAGGLVDTVGSPAVEDSAKSPPPMDSPVVQPQQPADLTQDQTAAMPGVPPAVPRDDGATTDEARTEQNLTVAKKLANPPQAQAVLRTIQIRSEPPGAKLSVNGKPQDTTYAQGLQLPDGSYRLSMSLSGYRTVDTSLIVNDLTPAQITILLPKLGRRIKISADVETATVYIDGHPSGFTTMTTDELKPGRHRVMVRKLDVGDEEAMVEVVENDIVSVAFKLTGKARGTLSMKGKLDDNFIRTLPQAVVVDGPISWKDKPEDAAPRVRRDLPPGRYVIEYRHKDYASVRDTVWVKPGETVKSSKTLRRR